MVAPDVAALTVTVVIPAHNEERDLGETLDALMRQTVPPDRIIVVDDGSTDRTSEVAAGYQSGSPVRQTLRPTVKAAAPRSGRRWLAGRLRRPADPGW